MVKDKDMNSAEFAGLDEHFTTKISDLQKMLDIKLAVKDDNECLEHLQVSGT